MSYLKITAKWVRTLDLADSCSIADVRWIVQIVIQMKCSPIHQHRVKLEFGKVLSLLKFIMMTSIFGLMYFKAVAMRSVPHPALEF